MVNLNFGGRNKVTSVDGLLKITLDVGEDFPFDIEEVAIYYDPGSGKVDIKDERIPKDIRENMLQFFGDDVRTYVSFLERHLECFFRGEVPSFTSSPSPSLKDTSPEEKGGIFTVEGKRVHPVSLDISAVAGYKGPLNVEFSVYRSNVSFFVCKSLRIYVECARCKKNTRIEKSGRCPGCGSSIELRYSFAVDSHFLGNLALLGAKFVRFDTMLYQLGCLGCGECYETAIEKGASVSFACLRCRCNMMAKLQSLEFKHKELRQASKPGELPSKGACTHYKRSFRWFRFPCCNALFPCDICHNAQSDHDAVLASKMVCGLCGKEQSTRTYCSCGMSIKGKSSFWEGGKGTRDKTKMSKRDKKKYKM